MVYQFLAEIWRDEVIFLRLDVKCTALCVWVEKQLERAFRDVKWYQILFFDEVGIFG